VRDEKRDWSSSVGAVRSRSKVRMSQLTLPSGPLLHDLFWRPSRPPSPRRAVGDHVLGAWAIT